MVLRFADVVLDVDRMHLERGGAEVAVEPQVFEVLAYLVRHRDRMVPKTELLDEIWGDRFVSESALTSRIKSARKAIGDNGRDQRLIRTVHGRGFRFVGDVTEVGDGVTSAPVASDGAWTATGLGAQVVRCVEVGRGMLVELVGSSGQGRTEVLDDVVAAARDAGLLVGRGGAGELRALAGVLGAFDEWTQRRPELFEQVPAACAAELEDVLGGAPPSSRQRLHLAARELVAAAGASGGAVLAIDDVHLIDRVTLELLEQLVGTVRRVPVGLVVSHRPGFAISESALCVDLDVDGPGARAGDDHDVPAAVRDVLSCVAVVGEVFEVAELEAASGLDGVEAGRALDLAVAAGLVEPLGHRYRFVDGDDAARLASTVSPSRQREILRSVAARLDVTDGRPGRIADLYLRAGDLAAAGPHLVAAATSAAWAQQHGEVLDLTERVDEVSDPDVRFSLLELRADAAAALGLPEAVERYRAAIRLAPPDRLNWLRARLGRVLFFLGDLDSAAEVLDGVAPDGSVTDGGVLLILGTLAYFQGDLARAEELAERGREAAFVPGAPPQMLDSIALQGMIAHSRGEWFDRLRRELRFATQSNQVVTAVFDAHVCVAQYLLYGPTGRDEVVRLAQELGDAATRAGARRATGFALTLSGEARLLAGDLAGARADLVESVDVHTAIGADTGRAHALQRLADVELADGNRAEAERLCRQALPLARWSPLAHHLLQRTYGTLIAAAPDRESALAAVEEALGVLDEPNSCEFCQVMVAVPAAIAFATAGHLDRAREQLDAAARCAARWEGPAWPAAVDEARAVLAAARGEVEEARRCFAAAAAGFEAAHQPLDVARCLEALGDVTPG